MIDVRPINTPEDHAWALREVEFYFVNEPAPGTLAAVRFDTLANLIEKYEQQHFPMDDNVDPIDVLNFAMQDMGRTRAELNDLIRQPHASEVLHRKRKLSLNDIRKISAAWHIPADILIADYDLAKVA